MTGSAIQISPNEDFVGGGYTVYCSVLSIQNNGSNNMRVGDNTVTATRGQLISSSGSIYTAPCPARGTRLSDWWIIGTSGDTADILYEPSN